MPWVMRKRDLSISGERAIRLSKVSRLHDTKPGGGRLDGAFFFFLPSPARRRFSITCSGAWATTLPASSKPLRPARPAICLKSRTRRIATFWPSYLASLVKSTVRIGMLTPTPKVSVPQITLSSPCWANCSMSSRYLGKSPAWWMPTPKRMKRRTSLP